MYYYITHDKKITISLEKYIDKRTKKKSKCRRGGGLNLCPLTASMFPELKR